MAELLDGPTDDARRQRADTALVNLFGSPEGLEDPTRFTSVLRQEAPVHVSAFGGVVFSRYDDCRAILRDDRFGNGNRPNQSFGAGSPEATAYRLEMIERRRDRPLSMLALDPPDHTRQRSLVNRAFTPRRIEEMRDRIAALADRYLDQLAEAGTGDAMELLALPLPVSVISAMLGVPDRDWPEIRSLVTDLVLSLEPAATVDDLKRSETAGDALWAYFDDLAGHRRARPADDLLTDLLAAEERDDRLSHGEVLAVSVLLFAAGAETTTNLIGNGLAALFTHPDQQARLWADPALVPTAVEEILRFDSPVQIDGRTALEPIEACGVRFEAGDRLLTLLGAANRDPDHFDEPDRFDVGRHGEAVMSFGSGIHYCLGANLARAEAQEVFAAMIRRFSAVEPAGDRPRQRRMILRGLQTCPVRVTPR
ncbi:MAG: cytochrome P450 [Acidimicrobiales bacterium]